MNTVTSTERALTVSAGLLAKGLVELCFPLSAEQQGLLVQYLVLLEKWNQVYNLTAIRDLTKMVGAHLLDSLSVIPHLSGENVLDVGSGAGLPGIPLALLWPDTRVTLLDSNHKKAAFLRQAVIELELKNVEVVNERVETWEPPRKFDLVISRAFSDLAEFLRLAGKHVGARGTIAAMKGVYPDEELAQIPAAYTLRTVVPLEIPGMPAARHLILLEPAH